ncbi:PRD domain-containing protein [Lachnospiraceae bacterium AM23-2LB]|nr:PRD domain-containing protein [Lachnospiraceae bacterium AM23-2LB]
MFYTEERGVGKMEDYVPEIVRLVKESAEIEFRESGFSYERFVQHMRCLIVRAEKKEAYQGAGERWAKEIKKDYPEAFEVAQEVRSYLRKKTNYRISDEETAYVAIHIQRLIDRGEKRK